MSEDLMQEIVRVFESVSALGYAQRRFDEMMSAEVSRLWNDNAELRDELHALANRVDTLTRARMVDPAEVVERMVAQGYLAIKTAPVTLAQWEDAIAARESQEHE